MPTTETTCDRCQKRYGPLDDMRFRAGNFREEQPDGTVETYDQLCEDCHREVTQK